MRADGYVTIKTGVRRYELEHRLIVERAVGRRLRTSEHVHHINGERADNRLENLRIMSAHDHGRIHGKQSKGKS